MQKVLILCRQDDRSDYDQIDTFSSSLGKLDTKCEYTFGELEKLVFFYDGKDLKVYSNDIDVASYDQLFLIGWFKTKILEDIALSVATYMKSKSKIVQNSEALFTRSRSKLSQYVIAAINNIDITPFLFCKDKAEYHKAFSNYWSLPFPVIMKGVQSSRGNDNYLLEDIESVFNTIDLIDSDNPPWFVAQGFVPNDGDYRIIVMGDEVTYILHRKTQSASHLNNTSKGGLASEIDVASFDPGVLKQCIKLSKLLRREITGVDMIQHSKTGRFYLLEINNMPQLATGSNVSQKLRLLDSYFSRVAN